MSTQTPKYLHTDRYSEPFRKDLSISKTHPKVLINFKSQDNDKFRKYGRKT